MITLSADHYFDIGYMHVTGSRPCQDYALSGGHGDAVYAVVSDGCSTGGDTDIGARIISLSLAQAIKEHWASHGSLDRETVSHISFNQLMTFRQVQHSLGLAYEDMLATYAYAYFLPIGGVVHMRGDGVVASMHKDGSIIASRLEWANNMPFYPAYKDDGYEAFIRAHGGDLSLPAFFEERVVISPDGFILDQEKNSLTLAEGIAGFTINYSYTDPKDAPLYVAVFSDGVAMVDGLDWKDVVQKLLSFKNTNGEFAKRRAIRVIKDAKRTGHGPIDDIAYSVVKITQEEVTNDTG